MYFSKWLGETRFVTLRTRLSPQECYRRLQPVTLPWLPYMLVIPWLTSKLPLMGWVDPAGFAVRKRMEFFKSSSMQPEAKAQFVAAPDGTLMRVRVGPRRWIIIVSWVGLPFIVLYMEALMMLCRYQGNPRCSGPFVYVLPFVLASVFLLFQAWGWAAVRGEAEFLVAFLKQILEAEEAQEIPAPIV